MRVAKPVRAVAVMSAVAVASATLFTLATSAHHAGAADDPEMLLERARTAASRESFRGLLNVSWRDGNTVHEAKVFARAADGAIQLGFEPARVAAHGLERWIGDATGWHELWQEPQRASTPHAGSRWELTLTGYHQIVGRRAALITASDHETKKVRARFWVDTERGLLLRREILDRRGRVERSVGFSVIKGLDGVAAPSPPRGAEGRAPEATVRVPDGYPAPKRLAGYELLSRYRHDDSSVQLFYGDGVFTMSVFEQPGDVGWDSLPGGREREIEGTRTRSYSTATANVVVWGQDGLTLTCVGDAPTDELEGVVRRLHTSDANVLSDIADFVLGPFDWD